MRGKRVAATLFAAGVLAVGAGVSPAAATTDVLVSADGETFAPALPNSLFDQAGQLVPGESITAELWITNPAPLDAAMRVSVHDIAFSSAEFADGVTMTVWDSGTGAVQTSALSEVSDCQTLVASHVVKAGATERMRVVLTMADDVDGVIAQGADGTLDFGVAMRDATGGALGAKACDPDATVVPVTGPPASGSTAIAASRGGVIAYTGGEVPVPLIAVAAALIGAGLFLITRRRRDRGTTDDSRVG